MSALNITNSSTHQTAAVAALPASKPVKTQTIDSLKTAQIVRIAQFLPGPDLAAFPRISRKYRYLAWLHQNEIWEPLAKRFDCSPAEKQILGTKKAVQVAFSHALTKVKQQQQKQKEELQKKEFYEETMSWLRIGTRLPNGLRLFEMMKANRVPLPAQAQTICNEISWQPAMQRDFSELDLHRIPQAIRILTVVELNLSYNHLSTLPAAILTLPYLTSLNLQHNDFEVVPDLSRLKQLQVLNLAQNQIKGLPDAFAGLTCLTALNLSENPIGKVPPPVLKMPNLQRLFLNFTAITSFPCQKKIKLLQNLFVLEIAGNMLGSKLPMQLRSFKNLRALNIAGCKFTEAHPRTLEWLSTMTIAADVNIKALIINHQKEKSAEKAPA